MYNLWDLKHFNVSTKVLNVLVSIKEEHVRSNHFLFMNKKPLKVSYVLDFFSR